MNAFAEPSVGLMSLVVDKAKKPDESPKVLPVFTIYLFYLFNEPKNILPLLQKRFSDTQTRAWKLVSTNQL
jgi:hypothetical protein